MISVFTQFENPHGNQMNLVTLLVNQTVTHDGGAGINA
jgi:hypothetical protein